MASSTLKALFCALSCVWFCGHGAARAEAEPDKPWMAVAFEIASPTFKRTLAHRALSEANLARRLAEELSPRHRFADWRAVAAPAGAPMGTLIARLVESDASPYPKVEVKWFVKLPAGAEAALPQLPEALIYAPTNPNWDTSNNQGFETHVFEQMLTVVRTGGFQKATFDEVLRKLPIANKVRPLADEHVLLVPLLWKHLRLGPGSELAVKFSTSGEQGVRQGQLQLTRINERGREPWRGFLQAGIKDAQFDAQVLPLERQWNAALPGLLANATVSCFIAVYESAEFGEAAPGQTILDPN